MGLPSSKPLPPLVRPAVRLLLRTVCRLGVIPGSLSYQAIEKWGHRLARGPLDCSLFTGAKVRCDLRDHVQRQMYFFGAHELVEAYLFKAVLGPGMVVVDAGANVGQYSLIAAAEVGGEGAVHAFEPVPRTFMRLVSHLEANGLTGIVRANSEALWHRDEPVRLSLRSELAENTAAYSVAAASMTVDTITCRGVRLDDYVKRGGLTRVDVMKIDIEGAELFALQGATEVLARWRPMIFIELSRYTCNAVGYDPQRILEFVKPYGYEGWLIGDSPGACRRIHDLTGVDFANVILHANPLPEHVTAGWSVRGILRRSREYRV